MTPLSAQAMIVPPFAGRGRADELLAKVDLARAQGARIHCDQYPYTASSNGMKANIPQKFHALGVEKMIEMHSDILSRFDEEEE